MDAVFIRSYFEEDAATFLGRLPELTGMPNILDVESIAPGPVTIVSKGDPN